MASPILWLTENYPPQRGGMSQSCDRIISHLRQIGYEIHVLHFTNKGGRVERVQHLNGTYWNVPFQESEAQTLHLAWQHISPEHFSMIVCFGGYLPVLAAPVYASWLSLPLVTLLRGNDFDTAIFTPRKRDLLRDACQAAKVVCTVSSDKVEKIRTFFSVQDVRSIANGITSHDWFLSEGDKTYAHQWRAENLAGKICLGLFGQMNAKKGLSFLADALDGSALASRVHLLLVGDVQEPDLALLGRLGVSYTALNFVDRFELLRHYACCDAVVIPSLYDGMPNVLLEAGALGIPVMASAVDGMRDVIEHGVSGLLFAPVEESALRKVLFEFIEYSEASRQALGRQLQQTIQTIYTVENETKKYDQLFREILGANGAAFRVHQSNQ